MPRSPISTNLKVPESSPEISPPLISSKFRLIILIALLALTILGVFAYLYPILREKVTSPPPPNSSPLTSDELDINTDATVSPTPTPTPKPLPKGSQTYTYSHGQKVTGPKPIKATIDPIDPEHGQTQTLTITITHNQPVTSADIIVKSDNKEIPLPLNLVSGTTTDGTWQASWKMEDTYNQTYQIDFSLSDSQSIFKGGLAFR